MDNQIKDFRNSGPSSAPRKEAEHRRPTVPRALRAPPSRPIRTGRAPAENPARGVADEEKAFQRPDERQARPPPGLSPRCRRSGHPTPRAPLRRVRTARRLERAAAARRIRVHRRRKQRRRGYGKRRGTSSTCPATPVTAVRGRLKLKRSRWPRQGAGLYSDCALDGSGAESRELRTPPESPLMASATRLGTAWSLRGGECAQAEMFCLPACWILWNWS
ncbi:uncharacterized protein [Alexandromys fortis]|uniref:uncharacterized protein n=1 Tax=Alexandromys fortis TaxID=100897 RepID=UPI002152C4B6|nr:uncharacterized protein LOC126488543 [Microtus fortis]